MKDGTVAGNLSVKGTSTFQSGITALYGVDLGFDNTSVLVISAKRLAQLTGDLNIVTGGIKFDDNYIIHVKNNNVISFSASNKILNLGDDNTKQINLQTSIYDDDGEYEMISKFGSAYFPESFKAGHNLGNILIETYKKSSEDSGVIFRRYIRLKSEDGPGFYSDGDSVFFEAPFKYNKVADDDTVQISEIIKSSFGYVESLSLYAPLNRKSSSLMFSTDADFFVFDKPIEKTQHKLLLSNMDKPSAFITKHYKAWILIFLILLFPAIYGNNHTKIYYNIAESLPETLDSNVANAELNKDFNMSNLHMLSLIHI